jgi:hypothetical protein
LPVILKVRSWQCFFDLSLLWALLWPAVEAIDLAQEKQSFLAQLKVSTILDFIIVHDLGMFDWMAHVACVLFCALNTHLAALPEGILWLIHQS